MDHSLMFTVPATAVLMVTAFALHRFKGSIRRGSHAFSNLRRSSSKISRAFSGLLAAILVLTLAGCGVTQPQTAGTAPEEPQDKANAVSRSFEYSFVREEVSEVGFKIRSYYIVSWPSPDSKDEQYIEKWKVLAAESFGYELDDNEVTLQDSKRFGNAAVLICNCTYGGDGAERTYIYGWTDKGLEKIYIDMDALDLADWDNTGTLSYQQYYDAEARQFVIEYKNKDGKASSKTLDLSALDDENVFKTDEIMAAAD